MLKWIVIGVWGAAIEVCVVMAGYRAGQAHEFRENAEELAACDDTIEKLLTSNRNTTERARDMQGTLDICVAHLIACEGP